MVTKRVTQPDELEPSGETWKPTPVQKPQFIIDRNLIVKCKHIELRKCRLAKVELKQVMM